MTKLITHLSVACILFSIQPLLSQNLLENKKFCGTEIPTQQWEAEIQKLIAEKEKSNSTNKGQVALYTIPVIIHVIHGGQAIGTYPNLAQAQLVSQIQVLNEDFGGIGFNHGNYPPQAFTSYAASNNIPTSNLDVFGRIKIANCMVQFCLATTDTLGNPLIEPGIERLNYNTKGWQNPTGPTTSSAFQALMNGTIKPQSIWNVSKYLNIWVSGVTAALLGYATFPPLSALQGIGTGGTNTTDGIWCVANAFGSGAIYPQGTYNPSYNRGRTATHEIGHYMGLRHIWGDGTCANDYCTDTPPASAANYGSANYPYKTTNCFGNSPNGEMFMDFMDYMDDPAQYMFTEDQATRVQTAMSSSPYRMFLGTHNLCSITPIAATSAFVLPASLCGTTAVITMSNQATGLPLPTYTWNVSGGASFFPNANSAIAQITFPSPGTYTVSLSTSNGTLSTTTKTVTLNPYPVVSVAGPTAAVCQGEEVTLTASGGNTYAWAGGVLGPTNTFIANSNKTFTVIATGPGNCKTLSYPSVTVMICTGFEKNAIAEQFSLYPNPAAGTLFVKLPPIKNLLVELVDLNGKIFTSKTVKTEDPEISFNIASLSPGIYLIRLTTADGVSYVNRFLKQ